MVNAKTEGRYEVIVCGDSLFAVWTSILLSRQGVRVLRLHKSASGFDSRETALDVAFSTLVDPPTRALVAHGKEVADYLCQFVARGASQLGRELQLQPLRSVRLAVAAHEQRELIQAARDFPYLVPLSSSGDAHPQDKVAWSEPASYQIPGAEEFSEMVLKLEPAQNRMHAIVTTVEESSTGVVVRCDDGQVRSAEVCVLAQGADIAKAVERYASILVPVTDVRASLHIPAAENMLYADPLCFRAASGHVAGCLIPSIHDRIIKMNVSGPRYALFHAGAGWRPSEVGRDGFLPKGQIPLSKKTWSEGLGAVLPAALRGLNPSLDFADEVSAAAAMLQREEVARDFALGTSCGRNHL
jgi:hypothetical protein